jgi:glycine oxidase
MGQAGLPGWQNKSMDVLIVGAGLIGSATAWRLAQAGARVKLIDSGRFGGETSSAGAGMLSPGGEFDRPSVWLDLGVAGMRMYPAFVEELRAETKMLVDFEQCGCMHLVEPDQARARAAFQSACGIQVEIASGGLFYSDDGFVDPTDLLRALRCACQARGVEIAENRPISEIESTDHDAVVIAAGAWSDQVRVAFHGEPIQLPPVKPVKGHLVGFDLAPGSLGPMLRHGHTYVLQRSSGFTLAGSNEEDAGFDRSVNPETCRQIHRDAAQLFPALERATPSKSWIGFRPYSPEPNIRRVEGTNVWLAYGHFRNGILLTPLTAGRIAAEITRAK